MTSYRTLVDHIAELSGKSPDDIQDILFMLPIALLELTRKDLVRTPLGVFRMVRRSARSVLLPGKGTSVVVGAEMVVKMKAGKRLRMPAR